MAQNNDIFDVNVLNEFDVCSRSYTMDGGALYGELDIEKNDNEESDDSDSEQGGGDNEDRISDEAQISMTDLRKNHLTKASEPKKPRKRKEPDYDYFEMLRIITENPDETVKFLTPETAHTLLIVIKRYYDPKRERIY